MFRKVIVPLLIVGMWFFSVEDRAEVKGANWRLWTTDEGSTVPKDEFGWEEQPYSYFFVSEDFFNTTPEELDIKWQWFYTNGEQQYEEHYFYFPWDESIDEGGNFRIWESPQNWLSIRKLGDWEAKVVWKAKVGDFWTGYRWKTADFTVTPEPVSGILFLVGGVSLAVVRLRKKRSLES